MLKCHGKKTLQNGTDSSKQSQSDSVGSLLDTFRRLNGLTNKVVAKTCYTLHLSMSISGLHDVDSWASWDLVFSREALSLTGTGTSFGAALKKSAALGRLKITLYPKNIKKPCAFRHFCGIKYADCTILYPRTVFWHDNVLDDFEIPHFVCQKDCSFPLLQIKPSAGNGLNMIEHPSELTGLLSSSLSWGTSSSSFSQGNTLKTQVPELWGIDPKWNLSWTRLHPQKLSVMWEISEKYMRIG